ncbi:hypothetical protein C8R42DRAFT_8053 [Lentinula raphanica]|nr:hypothetical protein C8R42DRAFT_8053 [Lentinula raphanica]
MAHSRSRSDSILILLALGAALSSIAVAAPLHPASVLTRREDHRDLGDNDLFSCPFDNHAAGAGCSTPDLSQLLPEGLSTSREDDPNSVHRLIFHSSSSPLPGSVTARAVVLGARADNALSAVASAQEIHEAVQKILSNLEKSKKYTVDKVYSELQNLPSWIPDLLKVDGDSRKDFYETISGKIYDQLVKELREKRHGTFVDKVLWIKVDEQMQRVSPSMARAKEIWNELMRSPGALDDLTASARPTSEHYHTLDDFKKTTLYQNYLAKRQELLASNQPKVAAALERVMGDACQTQTWNVVGQHYREQAQQQEQRSE